LKNTKADIEEPVLIDEGVEIKGQIQISLHLCRKLNLPIYPEELRAQIDLFVGDFPHYNIAALNNYLTFRTFMLGHVVTLADYVVWAAINENINNKLFRLARWSETIKADPFVKRYISQNTQKQVKPDEKVAKVSPIQVCTRFAPEPSGYLHVGHAKAALASEGFARANKGKFILRFDDTNPKNESEEFEKIIAEDVALLDLHPDAVEHTSDYIPRIIDVLVDCLKRGLAYIDDTPQEQMSKERLELIPSKHRDDTVEQNLKAWEEMLQRTEYGLKCVVRAKIDYKNENGCLRDPVIARHIENGYHPKTGTKYPVFPVYDFACPIVDSDAGVTHAMRSWEYTDRDHLYRWFVEKIGLRNVKIVSFSRLAFTQTVLGKRHLRRLVACGKACGWDDPRFPTVRGMRRRGLLPQTIRMFCEMQGASRNQNLHGWDKIWSMNRSVIEPIIPRVLSVGIDTHVPMTVADVSSGVITYDVSQKKKDLGVKNVPIGPNIWIEQEDSQMLQEGVKVTLFHWCNVIVDKIVKEDGVVKSVEAHYIPDQDYKTTKKINWIVPDGAVKITMREWNFLLKKDALEENEDIVDAVTEIPNADTVLLCEPFMATFGKGQIVQLERRAEIIIDEVENNQPSITFLIPTGAEKPIGLQTKIQLFKHTE